MSNNPYGGGNNPNGKKETETEQMSGEMQPRVTRTANKSTPGYAGKSAPPPKRKPEDANYARRQGSFPAYESRNRRQGEDAGQSSSSSEYNSHPHEKQSANTQRPAQMQRDSRPSDDTGRPRREREQSVRSQRTGENRQQQSPDPRRSSSARRERGTETSERRVRQPGAGSAGSERTDRTEAADRAKREAPKIKTWIVVVTSIFIAAAGGFCIWYWALRDSGYAFAPINVGDQVVASDKSTAFVIHGLEPLTADQMTDFEFEEGYSYFVLTYSMQNLTQQTLAPGQFYPGIFIEQMAETNRPFAWFEKVKTDLIKEEANVNDEESAIDWMALKNYGITNAIFFSMIDSPMSGGEIRSDVDIIKLETASLDTIPYFIVIEGQGAVIPVNHPAVEMAVKYTLGDTQLISAVESEFVPLPERPPVDDTELTEDETQETLQE